jgi:NAD(P)-dependent dehydrogenase (short-subunit alcohol dehydrogenase family)
LPVSSLRPGGEEVGVDGLAGRVAVVTGGASGIGRALVERLATEGMTVVAVDVDGPAVAAVSDAAGAVGRRLDVTDGPATTKLVGWVEADIGPIDLFCMNAGVATAGGVEMGDAEWQRTWDVNVMAHVHGARAVLPAMLARRRGHLLHTASAAGLLTTIGAAAYSVTKHAVVALAEWLAVTYGDRGIQVSCLCPQFVSTPMLDAFDAGGDMRRWVDGLAVTPEHVADAVVDGLAAGRFLILPHADVAGYYAARAADTDRWLAGMRRLQAGLGYEPPPLA